MDITLSSGRSCNIIFRETTRILSAVTDVEGAKPIPVMGVAMLETDHRWAGSTGHCDLHLGVGTAFWADFRGVPKNCAILMAVQHLNPRTGQPAVAVLSQSPQNYYLPEDRWADGWRDTPTTVLQFVGCPAGYSVAEYNLPEGLVGSDISVAIFELDEERLQMVARSTFGGPKGVGAGGKIIQSYRQDTHQLYEYLNKPSGIIDMRMVFDGVQPSVRPSQADDGAGFLKKVPKL